MTGRLDAVCGSDVDLCPTERGDEAAIENANLLERGLACAKRENTLGEAALGTQALRVVEDGGVLAAHDADGAGEHLGFAQRVILEATVPVEVIIGEVKENAHVRGELARPMKLEGGKLGAEHVHALLVRERVKDGDSDIAHGDGAVAGARGVRRHDGSEHARGRRLAIGAGDDEPRAGRAKDLRMVKAVGQLYVADDLAASCCRRDEQWRVRAPARGGHHDVKVRDSLRGLRDRDRCHAIRQLREVLRVVVGDRELGAQSVKQARAAQAGHARAGNEDAALEFGGKHEETTTFLGIHKKHRASGAFQSRSS